MAKANLNPNFDQIISDWFVASFHNNAVSRNEEVYNTVVRAVADLKVRLGVPTPQAADEGTDKAKE
jgi:hypothetical protein